MGNLRQSFARMRGKKNFTDQKTNDCRSISNSLSQDEILSNQECGYTNVRFTKIQRSIPPTKIERMSTSSSSGFSPISSHSNISTNKNNLNYSRLRAPSLGVSGSIIARRNSSNKSETLNNGKKNLGENSSVDTKGCLLM
uniref:Uncharacterized protein n=1 Tax=Meloidogyne hapla TaxID=6305 RepID=A0A1I8BYN6_MELHA